MKTRIISLALLVSLCPACREDSGGASGELRMGLVGSDVDGNLYRLRDGTFTISGPPDASVSTEDEVDPQDSILVDLPAGDYQIALEDGWRVERWDPATDTTEDVAAVLTSANPAEAEVLAEITTPVVFSFFVDGAGPVPLGDGGVEIDVSFDDACAEITDPATCDGFESCEFDAALGVCVEAGPPPASGTVEWRETIAGVGGSGEFEAIDVDGQGRILAVGDAQSPFRALAFEFATDGTATQIVQQPDTRMTALAFDDAGTAWIGVSGPGTGSAADVASLDLDTGNLTIGPPLGSGDVVDVDAAAGAAFLGANDRLVRVRPDGSLDFDVNAQLSGDPLAVATETMNPAQPLLLSRDGGQLRLRRMSASGSIADAPVPLFVSSGAAMEALGDGSVIIAAADGGNLSIAVADLTGTFTMLASLPAGGGDVLRGLDVLSTGEAAVAYDDFGQTRVARIDAPSGTLHWEVALPPADIIGEDVAIGPDRAVYIAGRSNLTGNDEPTVVRLAP